MLLPSYDFIHQFLLFTGSAAEIYTGRFNTFVPHQIGEQSNIIIFFKKVLCVAMPERVGIAYGGGQRPLVRSRTAAVRSE